jgi:outer membrane protein assembly factor BamB
VDARVLSELRSARDRRALAATAIVDVVGIEVDGVDLAAGLSEENVPHVTAELAAAVAALAGGRERASVGFPAAGVELLLERRGPKVLLSMVQLSRPSRLVLRKVEVEFGALRRATLDCGRLLLRDLIDINPAFARTAVARRLGRSLRTLRSPRSAAGDEAGEATRLRGEGSTARLADPGARSAASGRRRPASKDAIRCTFEIQEADRSMADAFDGGDPDLESLLMSGRVSLMLGHGESWSKSGAPFLLLRDLAASAQSLVRALEAGDREHHFELGDREDLRLDLLGRDAARISSPSSPGEPLALAHRIFKASLAFEDLIVAQNPRQRTNGYLVELRSSAQEGLARCRELRAASPRRSPRPKKATRGTPSTELLSPPSDAASRLSDGLRTIGSPRRARKPPWGAGRIRRLSYHKLWSLQLSGLTQLLPPTSASGLVIAVGGGVTAVDLATGKARWRGPAGARFCEALPSGDLLMAGGSRVDRIDPLGQPRWSGVLLGQGEATGLVALSSGSGGVGVVASTSEVVAFGLASGAAHWRFRPPGCSGIRVFAARNFFLLATSDGRIYAIEAAHGRLLWRARSGQRPVGVLFWPDRAILLSQAPEGAQVLRLDLASGTTTPCEAPDLTRVGVASRLPRGFAVPGSLGGAGAVVCYGSRGRVRWRYGGEDDGPGPGTPTLCAAGGDLIVRGGRTVVCLDPEGRPRWERPFDEELPAGPPPLLQKDLLLVVGEGRVLALDPANGDLLGQAEDRALLPSLMVVNEQLTLFCGEEEGLISAFAVGRHLSVVN